MKKILTAALIAALSIPFVVPLAASAFTLEWSNEGSVVIHDPARATGYAGKLVGEPHEYTFSIEGATAVYFTILVPDTTDAKRDISAALVDTSAPDVPVGIIVGAEGVWKPYTYQGDAYLQSQEFRAVVPRGSYQLIVWSSNNDSPYVLIVGEKETTIFSRIAGALSALPTVRTVFFGRSAASVVFAPLILVPILLVIMAVLAAAWLVRRAQ